LYKLLQSGGEYLCSSFVFSVSDDRAKKAKAENWLAQFNVSIPAAHANTVRIGLLNSTSAYLQHMPTQ
jgi:hypothetical protein